MANQKNGKPADADAQAKDQPETSRVAEGEKTQTIEAYKIEQLEKRIAELKESGDALSVGQLKQAFYWLGVPVAVATSTFGAALWITISTIATDAAEDRANDIASKVAAKIAADTASTVATNVAIDAAREAAISAAKLPAEEAASRIATQIAGQIEEDARRIAQITASDAAETVATTIAESHATRAARDAAVEPAERAARLVASEVARQIERRATEVARDIAGEEARRIAPEFAANAGIVKAIEVAREVAESQATIAATRIAEGVAERVATEAAGNVAQDKIIKGLAESDDFIEAAGVETARLFKDAVVAFDRTDGCPAGWERFWPATSRMVIGAATQEEMSNVLEGFSIDEQEIPLSPREFRVGRGAETHTLTVEEMPRHRHPVSGTHDDRYVSGFGFKRTEGNQLIGSAVPIPADGPSAWATSGQRVGNATQTIVGKFTGVTESKPISVGTEEVGGAEAHNNMPPYIALYFCKKEG